MSLSSLLPMKESDSRDVPVESSFGHKIVYAAGVAGSGDNSTALAVGKRGKGDEDQMVMMQPPIGPSHKRICLPQVDGGAGSVLDSDSDSDDDVHYDAYYDHLPRGKGRDSINNYFMHEMELAAAQACKDSSGGLELKDFEIVKSNNQLGGSNHMYHYIIFRAMGSSDGKTRCYVAKVTSAYGYESSPVMTVEFVRQIDDLTQVTETEWPRSRGEKRVPLDYSKERSLSLVYEPVESSSGHKIIIINDYKRQFSSWE